MSSTAKFAKKFFSSMKIPPNQLTAQTSLTPDICLIFSLYEYGREKVREMAFLATMRFADERSTPE